MGNDTEAQLPKFIKERLAHKAMEEAQAEAARQKQGAMQRLIACEVKPFWSLLQNFLRADIAPLSRLGLLGHYQPGIGDNARITVTRPGSIFGQVYTDLSLNSRGIHCTGLDIGFYNLLFCAVSDTAIAVVNEQDSGHPPMTAEEAAEYVVERMVAHLESVATSGLRTR